MGLQFNTYKKLLGLWNHLNFAMTPERAYSSSTSANLILVSTTKNMKLKVQTLENFIHTCCIICGNSEQRVFRPWSSNIFSRVMSCSATKVVSSMSSPAWFANVKTGNACINWVSDSLALKTKIWTLDIYGLKSISTYEELWRRQYKLNNLWIGNSHSNSHSRHGK